MNKFEMRRRYLLSMFFITLNDRTLNNAFLKQLLADFMLEQLIWNEQIAAEKLYGEDTNEYLAFIEGCR